MAQEFDMFLRDRVVACDIVVSSIPYRDGITANNRMIIESCLIDYLLQKFVAAQTCSPLLAHINDMIKRCYEMINGDLTIGANVSFETEYVFDCDPSIMQIGVEDIPIVKEISSGASSALMTCVNSITLNTAKSIGGGYNTMHILNDVSGTLKNSILRLSDGQTISASKISTNAEKKINVSGSTVVNANIENLCYSISDIAHSTMEVAVIVLGSEIHFPLGHGYSGIKVDANLRNLDIRLYDEAASYICIASSFLCSLCKVLQPSAVKVQMQAIASSILQRYRLVSEIDEDDIMSYDSDLINDVDIVTIQE